MVLDKSLLVLIIITAITVLGMLLEPSKGSPSITRYAITSLGQFFVIITAVVIGLKATRFFTLKSIMGNSTLLISLGLLSWGLGALVWLFYNIILQTEVPYPSFADVGFLGTIPLAALGLFLLLKNIKIRFDSKTIIKILILPTIVFIITYWMFIHTKIEESIPLLEKVLNITYPLGDVVFLSFTLVILSLIKGGKLFKPIGIICIGFIVEAIADFSFSWTTSVKTYYTGNWVDILFTLAFFTIGVGMHYTKEVK